MKRLSEELPDGFARELLESAQHDAPSAAGAQRALAAAAAAVPLKSAAAALVLGKAGVTVLAAVMVVGGAAVLHTVLASRSVKARSPEPANVAPPRETERTEHVQQAIDEVPPAASPVAVPVRPARVASHVESAHTPSPRSPVAEPAVVQAPISDDLRAQVELIDRARTLVDQGDVAAVQLLDGYTRHWPQGPFVIDAAILAIEAERKSGAIEQARARAERVLADHPSAAYRARVRRALNDLPIP